jgi:hypothetical protein
MSATLHWWIWIMEADMDKPIATDGPYATDDDASQAGIHAAEEYIDQGRKVWISVQALPAQNVRTA